MIYHQQDKMAFALLVMQADLPRAASSSLTLRASSFLELLLILEAQVLQRVCRVTSRVEPGLGPEGRAQVRVQLDVASAGRQYCR